MKRLFSIVIAIVMVTMLGGCDFLPQTEEPNQAPFIDGSGYLALDLGSEEPDWKDYVTATDEEDGIIRITDSMIESDVDMTKECSYKVYIYVTDSDGKTSLHEITVEVIDTRTASITLKGNEVMEVDVNTNFVDPGVTASLSDGTPFTYERNTNLDMTVLGEYWIEYYNEEYNVDVSRTVNVVDKEAPVLENPYEQVYVPLNAVYSDYEIIVTDNYDTDVSITFTGAVDTSVLGDYVITYQATDTSGNVSNQVTRTITVIDQA